MSIPNSFKRLCLQHQGTVCRCIMHHASWPVCRKPFLGTRIKTGPPAGNVSDRFQDTPIKKREMCCARTDAAAVIATTASPAQPSLPSASMAVHAQSCVSTCAALALRIGAHAMPIHTSEHDVNLRGVLASWGSRSCVRDPGSCSSVGLDPVFGNILPFSTNTHGLVFPQRQHWQQAGFATHAGVLRSYRVPLLSCRRSETCGVFARWLTCCRYACGQQCRV